MEEHSLFEKAYQFVMLLVGGLVSFFFYRQRKVNDSIDKLDERIDKMEVTQASYNQSVEYLNHRFNRIEQNQDKVSDKIDSLILRDLDK